MTIENTSEYVTLCQAADLIGGKAKKKSTIFNAIKSKKLNPVKNEKGEWQIAKSDLFALYPQAIPVEPEPDLNEIIADLKHELQQEKELVSDLNNRLKRLESEIAHHKSLEIKSTDENVAVLSVKNVPENIRSPEKEKLIANLLKFIESELPEFPDSIDGIEKMRSTLEIYRNFIFNYGFAKSNFNRSQKKRYSDIKGKSFVYEISDEYIYKYLMTDIKIYDDNYDYLKMIQEQFGK
jgi:hypothetical protein